MELPYLLNFALEKPMMILIVDDNANDRRLLRASLEHYDCVVSEAQDGAEGLGKAREERPELIISDALMPVMDGFQFLRAVKADEGLKSIPFIFYSATYTGADEARLALSLGAEEFIIKPKEPREFWEEILSILEDAKLKKEKGLKPEILKEEAEFLKQYSHIVATKLEEKVKNLELECAARKEAEEKLRAYMGNISDIIWLIDANLNMVYVSPSVTRILGISSEELIGHPSALIIHPDDLEVVTNAQRYVMEHPGEPHTVQYRISRKDGSWIYVESTGINMIANPAINGVLVTMRDITERKKSEALITNILESVDEGFIIIDPEYKIISANRAYCKQVKSSDCDIIGRHCYEVSHHINKPCFEVGEVCAPMHTFKTGEATLSVHTHYDSENNPVYIETKSFPMKDASGKITAVIETLNNITDQKKLEDQLRQAQKMEAIGVLAGGVAHDFNNILSAIIGYGHLSLMKMKPDDPVRTNIDQIMACSQRAAALTQSLLLFSRKSVINPVLLDLNELLQRFEKFIVRLVREDIEFTCRCVAGALPIMADSGQIEQVIMNLVTNARDAMPEGGRLLIETDRTRLGQDFIDAHGYGVPGEFALLSITDTGLGMDETTKTHIFEPFFTTKEVGKGTGLGLSMVYGIVKKHDGFISVYSEPGKGTTFKIYLPISEVKAEPVEAHAEEPAQSLEGTETVLLAEDDEPVRRLTRTVLENFGYTVIEAADGEDAVYQFIANKDRIQLALLDAIMPKKNGGEVFREIKAMKPGLPVLFMSGYPAEIVGKQGILEPGIKFVPKPISPSDLLKKVREVLGK